jgi:hypothetical protein
VNLSFELDDEVQFSAEEIDDVPVEPMLPAKFQTTKPPIAQLLP